MSDLYTCSVCELRIHLDNLTDHVLLHEEYSAFSYNETTRIIEPLVNDLEEEEIQYTSKVSDDTSPSGNSEYPADTSDHAPHLSFSTILARNLTSVNRHNTALHSGASTLQNVGDSDEKYSQNNPAFVQRQYSSEHTGAICFDSVDNLTGIRMMANAAESLSKKDDENDILDYDGRNSNAIPIQKPLSPGDIIDTIFLPYLGSTSSERLLCECTIVFNRFIPDTQQSVNESGQSFSEYRNFYAHTYNENTGMSLEDIIEDGTDSDCNYEQYKDTKAGSEIIIAPKKNNVQGLRERRTGQKMEVYKYKEPLVQCDFQKELPKIVIPKLLKNPAVVKYLQSMTGETVTLTDEQLTKIEKQHLSKFSDMTVINVSKSNDDKVNGDVAKDSQNKEFVLVNEKTVTVKPKVSDRTNEHSDESNSLNIQCNQNQDSSVFVDSKKSSIDCFSKISLDLTGYSKDSAFRSDMYSENIQTDENNGVELMLVESEHDYRASVLNSELEKVTKDGRGEVIDTFHEVDAHLTYDKHPSENHTESLNSVDNQHDDGGIVNSPFTCPACCGKFLSEDKLKEHRLTHKICKKAEVCVTKLNHIEMPYIHDNIKENLENSVCEEIDTLEDGLFYCIICDIMLPAKAELQEHMKRHRAESTGNENIMKLDGTCASDDTLTADSDLDYVSEAEVMDEMDDQEQEVDDLEHGLIIEKRTRSRRKRKRKSDPDWLKENMCKKIKKRLSHRKEFICDNCGDSYHFVLDCLKHSSSCNVQSNVLKCFQGCGQVFKTRSELDYHKNFCSRRITYREKIGGIVEKIKKSVGDDALNELGTDVELDDGRKLMSCKKCELVFPFEELSSHKGVCKKKKLSGEVKSEILTDEEMSIHCQYCNRSFSSAEKMKFHELVCKLRPIQKCEFCDFSCKGNKPMSEHLVNKHNVNPFKCDLCSKTFKLKGSLKSHVKFNHTKETFTCEFCGKSFLKQSIYRSHVSIQHEGFRFMCKYCDKPFKDKRTWMMHEKSHKGAYDYACTVCKKTFNKSSKYKDHMKDLHSIDGETALALNSKARELREKLCTNICNVCGEKFPLVDAYDHHMLKEHGVLNTT